MYTVEHDYKNFKKNNNNKQVRATFGLILNLRYVCNLEKGAATTFIHILLSLCPVIMKTANWQPCFVMNVQRCLTPSFDITESPNPFRISGLLVKNIGPFLNKKIKIYFRIFIGILKPVQKLGGDSEIPYLAYSFSKQKYPQINFPPIFQKPKYFKTPNFFRRGATMIIKWL